LSGRLGGAVEPIAWEESLFAYVARDQVHKKLRDDLQLPKGCVVHSFRPTFLTRFGWSWSRRLHNQKVAGRSSVTISECYIHPTSEGQERAFERFANLYQTAVEKAEKEKASL